MKPTETLKMLKVLEDEMERISWGYRKRDGTYRMCMRAAFSKAYHFAIFCLSELKEDAAFFALGTLRGICEDLIVLTFLGQLKRKDRDSAMTAKAYVVTAKACESQENFLLRKEHLQPVFSFQSNDQVKSENEAMLKELGVKSGLWSRKQALPLVKQMAESVGMLELYEYFYALTSDLVHFNPRVLMRSGWGDGSNKFQFRPDNFSLYYFDFCRFYSVLLFVLSTRNYQRSLGLSSAFRKAISELDKGMHETFRWPEPVTYEEMNVKGPSTFVRALLHGL